MKNEKRYSIFNDELQALVLTLWKVWSTSQDCSQYNLSFFISLNDNLSLRDNRLFVFVDFSFSSGCDVHDRSQNR